MLWECFHTESSRLHILRCHPRQQNWCFLGPACVTFLLPEPDYCRYYSQARASKFLNKNSTLSTLPFISQHTFFFFFSGVAVLVLCMEPESANMPIDVPVLAVDFIGGLHSNACLQPACAWQSGFWSFLKSSFVEALTVHPGQLYMSW